MKIRVKFSKTGRMVYLGHLDIMRYFQKAIRRAGVDIAYSQGYNPHQKMSFSAPLSLGIESLAEYMDITLNSLPSAAWLKDILQKQMVPGMDILSITLLPDDAESAMTVLAAADYEVIVRNDVIENMDLSRMDAFYSQEEIHIVRKTKKSETEIDIKPLIYSLHEDDGVIFMRLASGSVQNLKPDLVMKAYFSYIGLDIPEHCIRIKRVEQFGENFVSLEDMGLQMD
ncbi:TIGR03936 family radical SAM-associated protein [Parasporobacterium paucivorans]|uniref:Radical SAM-linked protein n=1 Tax=Parasporobacterium paucivorans DSM 15970 TaxID=1122934 RepID=A0A1M6A5M2_9FIRM|nr:TIGR03936 family radical SAM-associated protein [Parasporobacterium paucivorans]SHI31758.1 radical SAM-linked protein [Parasporobacterium paucivorans DSM 15970]